jgi:ribosomal protein L11 methyltransferase
MSYLALSFDALATDAERWSDALLEQGALSVDTEDRNAGSANEIARYGEPDCADPKPWPVCRLTALFPGDVDVQAVFRRTSELAKVRHPPAHSVETVQDADWVRLAQSQFPPFLVAGNLWIVPTWAEPVDSRAINLRLDPGLAFGTGSHPTTRLCLQWLARHLRKGESLLDYGCGSGILAIAAAMLGAREVSGVDSDPHAVAASRVNAERNGVNARFGSPDEMPACVVDIVVANILANPLVLLAPVIGNRVRGGGAVVLSGILEPQAASVAEAYARWFNIDVWAREDGWVALSGTRRHEHG